MLKPRKINKESLTAKRIRKLVHLKEDEHCVLVVRKHWFVFLKEAAAIFFPALVLWVAVSVFLKMAQMPEPIITFWQSFIAFVAIILLFITWTNYWLDMWVVTNKRVIHVDQIKLFVRQVVATRIDRIQDVRAKVSGVIETLLDFGTLQVQTAGASSASLIIRGIPQPDEVRKVILEHLDQAISQALNRDGVGRS